MTDISTTGDCSSRLQDSERYAQVLVEALELAMDQRDVAAVRVGVLEGALREARDFIAYPGLVAPDSFAEDRRRELLAKLTDFAGGEAGKEKG